MYCAVLHWDAENFSAEHCNALDWSALDCTEMHYTEQHYTALHCTELNKCSLHCNAMVPKLLSNLLKMAGDPGVIEELWIH